MRCATFARVDRRHTADEEESLFPRLRAAEGACGLEELNGLESDHDQADEMHAAVDALYSKWIAAGSLGAQDEERLSSSTRRLKTLYEAQSRLKRALCFLTRPKFGTRARLPNRPGICRKAAMILTYGGGPAAQIGPKRTVRSESCMCRERPVLIPELICEVGRFILHLSTVSTRLLCQMRGSQRF